MLWYRPTRWSWMKTTRNGHAYLVSRGTVRALVPIPVIYNVALCAITLADPPPEIEYSPSSLTKGGRRRSVNTAVWSEGNGLLTSSVIVGICVRSVIRKHTAPVCARSETRPWVATRTRLIQATTQNQTSYRRTLPQWSKGAAAIMEADAVVLL